MPFLHFVGDPAGDYRSRYFPDDFAPGPTSARGHRVLLIEDTWVTGGTTVSVAGRLLREHAESVVIAPIARRIQSRLLGPTHPYWLAINREYDLDDGFRG